MDRFLLVIVTICAIFLSCSISPEVEKVAPIIPQNPHLQNFTKDYVHHFSTLLAETSTPGVALAIIKDDEVVHLSGYGTKSVNSNDSVDIHTVFRVGSLSKGFASVLAGIIIERGDLKWTDKVQRYVPEFVLKDAAQTKRVNLIHLLSQSSGLPYHAYTNLVERGLEIRNIASQLKKVKLISKEGEIYAYQNAAYSLIGPILEEVAKAPLSQIFKEEIFQPLNMQHASTDYQSLVNDDNLALPHFEKNGNWYNRKISEKYYNAVPAGGINASISDMAEWMQLLLGNRPDIINSKTLADIFKPRINSRNRNRYFRDWQMVEEAHYGLGWRILTNEQDTFIYHGGFVNGYRGELLLSPKEKLGICVLANAPSKFPKRSIPAFLEMYATRKDSINAWDIRLGSTLITEEQHK